MAGRTRWALGFLFLIAFALRLGLTLPVLEAPERSLTLDSLEYLSLAHALADGHGFVREQTLASGQRILVPEVFRTPGYPMMLAVAEKIWPGRYAVPPRLGMSVEPQIGPWVDQVLWLQVLIGSVTCLLVFGITRQLSSSRPAQVQVAALAAGFLLAVDLPSAVHTAFILSETMAACLIAIALVFGLRFLRGRNLADLFLCMASFVLAAHVRPIFLSIGLPLLAALFIGWRAPGRQLLRAWLVVGVTLAVGIGGWTLRNARTGGYAVFSAVNDFSWLYHGAGLEARATGGDPDVIVDRYRSELASELPADAKQLHQGRWYRAMRHKGLEEVRARWTLLPGYVARNLAQLMLHVDHESFRQVGGYPPAPAATGSGFGARLERAASGAPWLRFVIGAQLLATAVLWIGVLLAGVRLVRGRFARSIRVTVACFLLSAALGLAAGAMPNAQVRFRLSLLPILLPVAALGWFGDGSGRAASDAGVRRAAPRSPRQ